MNNAFGGLFTSRLNMNLREKNGYTYGVRSQVAATRQWGAFVVTTSVRTDVTAEALEQVFAETRRLAREPLTADEIARSKADLIQQVGAHLEHTSSVLGDAEELFIHGMEADYFRRFGALVRGIGPEAVRNEAQRLSPERMIAVLVGDRTAVQEALTAKGFRVELAETALTE
jgi:zinc protease